MKGRASRKKAVRAARSRRSVQPPARAAATPPPREHAQGALSVAPPPTRRRPGAADHTFAAALYPASGGLAAPNPALRRALPRPGLLIAAVRVLMAALLCAVCALGIQALVQRLQADSYVAAYSVMVGGRSYGNVRAPEQAQAAYEDALAQLCEQSGRQLTCPQSLALYQITAPERRIQTQAQLTEALSASMQTQVLATVITVNDRPAAALESPDQAQAVLDAVLQPYQGFVSDQEALGFVEDVQLTPLPVDADLLHTPEQAVRALTLGLDTQDHWYEVKSGDNLSRIAKSFGLTKTDLRRANPALANTDLIQPGQQINAVKPLRWVNVYFTQTVEREQEIPYQTVEEKTSTLYTTQKEEKQAGRNGVSHVVSRITYVNGIETDSAILSQTVLTEPRERIVLVGTKAVPRASSASSRAKFPLPLRSYRISSKFGPRKAPVPGASTYHKGVDLAAPKGTPIYASAGGTVSFSGSKSGYGLTVMINHGGGAVTLYGHCSKLLVKKGQKVDAGQIIALVGNTGVSSGPHCHFELRINGTPADPLKYK